MEAIDVRESTLIGCGILKKEISYLNHKNGWDLHTHFLNSSLHVDYDQLEKRLLSFLTRYKESNKIVFYGACHPNMDRFIQDAEAVRTRGQNCVEILLGAELYNSHLSSGAFFLMEKWALHWNTVMTRTFGDYPEVIREIFNSEHRYLLCLKTRCSGDYEEEAQYISKKIHLPLRCIDVSLDHLESVLTDSIHEMRRQHHVGH